MKFSKFLHKAISLVLMVVFAALIQGYSAPAPTAVKDSAETTVERGGDAAPGSFEKQDDEGGAAKKKKKFPWLLAGLGAVAVGVALYFLVKKKTMYTLAVTLDPGVSGSPLTTAKFKKGEVVRYNYAYKPDYFAIFVTLDGAPAPVSGSIVMDRDHAIAVSTVKAGFIQVNSTPAGAKIYLDGTDSGQVTPFKFRFTSEETRRFDLRFQCGRQDLREAQGVRLGYEATINAVLRQGIWEQFFMPLSPCWRPRTPANWRVVDVRKLYAENTTGAYEFIFYDHPFTPDLDIMVRSVYLRETKRGTAGVIFSTGTNMADSQGYEFILIEKDKYAIYKNYNYDHYKDKGYWAYIKKPTICPSRRTQFGGLNVIRIVKAGSNYTFYVNDKFVHSFRDAQWDVRYVALGIFDLGMKVDFGYEVRLNVNDTTASVPGLPAIEIPGKEDERGGAL